MNETAKAIAAKRSNKHAWHTPQYMHNFRTEAQGWLIHELGNWKKGLRTLIINCNGPSVFIKCIEMWEIPR